MTKLTPKSNAQAARWQKSLVGLIALLCMIAVGYVWLVGTSDLLAFLLVMALLVLLVMAVVGLIQPRWAWAGASRPQAFFGYLGGGVIVLVVAIPIMLPPAPAVQAQAKAKAEAEQAVQAQAKAEAKASAYQMVEDTSLGRIKRTVVVELAETVGDEVLVAIARTLVDQSGLRFERTFVNFCLAGQPCRPRWAVVACDPECVLKGPGRSSRAADGQLTRAQLRAAPQPVPPEKIIGTWLNTRHASLTHRLTLYREKGKLFLYALHLDRSSGVTEMVALEPKGKALRFERADGGGRDFRELFAVNAAGGLDYWGRGRVYYTAEPVQ